MKNFEPNEQNNANVCCHPISSLSAAPTVDVNPVIKYRTPANNRHTPRTKRLPTRSSDGIMKNYQKISDWYFEYAP